MPAVPSPIKLNDVCANLAQTAPQPLTYEGLCSWVEGIDWTQSDWADHVPEVDKEDDYARNILCLEPFEVVVLHWPAGVESAVHHHKGFWGTVVCLQGVLENVTYNLEDGGSLKRMFYAHSRKALCPARRYDSQNSKRDDQDALVTLHFYHPALEDWTAWSCTTCQLAPPSPATRPLHGFHPFAGFELPRHPASGLPFTPSLRPRMYNATSYPSRMRKPLNE